MRKQAIYNTAKQAILTHLQEEPFEETWIRNFRGAFIRFGEGAAVTDVAFPSDYFALRIGGLASDVTVSDAMSQIDSLGLQVLQDDIFILPSTHNGFRMADVVKRGAGLPDKLFQALETNSTNSGMTVTSVVPQSFRATRYNDVVATRVDCSWHKAVQVAWLHFATETNAKQIFRQFAEGAGRVCGYRVQAERPCRQNDINGHTWHVKLTQVPAQATETDIASELNPSYRPLYIVLSNPTYDTSPGSAFEQIKSLLMKIGPLDWSGSRPETVGRRFKYVGRYFSEDHAVEAVKTLNNRSLPFYGLGKLTVQPLFSARIKIAQYVYEAASRDIDALVRYSASQYVIFTIHPPYKQFRYIQIDGQAKDMVTSAKDGLNRVLDGELVTENGKAVWSASFATNGWAYQQVKKLGEELKVLVLRDKHKCELRLFGMRENFGKARMQIVEIVGKDPRSTWSIALNEDTLQWALKGGSRLITRALNEDKVALDIVSSPPKIIISGSQADHGLAMHILNLNQTAVSKVLELEAGSCCLCWVKAENARETSCGHVFCSDCFQDMCLSCTTATSAEQGVRCYGDFGKCSKVLSQSDIEDNLSSNALDQVLEKMLTAFIASDPQHYRYCPTPNCEQIYRLSKHSDVENEKQGWEKDFEFSCPFCFVALCATCHVSHDTVKCPRAQS